WLPEGDDAPSEEEIAHRLETQVASLQRRHRRRVLEYRNATRRNEWFEEGDVVTVKRSGIKRPLAELAHRRLGPYIVTKRIGTIYYLRDLDDNPVPRGVPGDLLLPYKVGEEEPRSSASAEPPTDEAEDDNWGPLLSNVTPEPGEPSNVTEAMQTDDGVPELQLPSESSLEVRNPYQLEISELTESDMALIESELRNLIEGPDHDPQQNGTPATGDPALLTQGTLSLPYHPGESSRRVRRLREREPGRSSPDSDTDYYDATPPPTRNVRRAPFTEPHEVSAGAVNNEPSDFVTTGQIDEA
ncbi:hypothetical protein GGI12_006290, partial [Dipsacomyces acuminosporus]